MSVVQKVIVNSRNWLKLKKCVRGLASSANILKSDLPYVEIPHCTIQEYIFPKFENFSKYTAIECGITGKKYTYGQIRKKCRNLGKNLRTKLKLQEGDVVAILLPNVPDFPVATLGIMEGGLVVTTLNPLYTPEEIARQLEDSSAKAIITLNDFYPIVKAATAKTKNTLPVLTIKFTELDKTPAGSISFDEFTEQKVDIPDFNCGTGDNLAFLPYSSGTTGLPKGVELLHKNIVSNLCQMDNPDYNFIEETNDNHQDIIPSVLPYFHIYGFTITLMNMFRTGCKIVSIPKFTPELYINVLQNHKCSVIFAAPPLVLFLAAHPDVKREYLGSVRTVFSGAAPLGALDEERFIEKAGNDVNILQGYGLTETSPVVTVTSEALRKKYNAPGSIGKPIPNTELKLIAIDDPKGTPLGPNQPGELLVRGPQVMKGYHNKPEQTDEVFLDGWLRTGDLMYYNEDGLLFVTERLKELIKVKGFQVAPAELEEIIRDFPNVEDAAVIGVPHPTSGELPRAYVVPKSSSKINVEELNNYVSEKVAQYKQLKGGIEIVEFIPKNASGKILRRELKRQYEAQNQ